MGHENVAVEIEMRDQSTEREIRPMTLYEMMMRRPHDGAVGIRRSLERLGPVFIKVGQFLATRPDLIGQQYCDEFLKLADRAPAVSWESVRRIMTEDLGRPPEDAFAWVDRAPLASASLAQVHLARTHDGAEVAVKVQRPHIRERVTVDLKRVARLGSLWKALMPSLPVSPEDLIVELRGWMSEELDLGRELKNMTRMGELAAGSPVMRVPQPYPELCGPRVITADYLRGVPFSEIVRLLNEGQEERIAALGFDREALARNLLSSMLTQIFRFRFFHADTHPGNLIALEDDHIGFVDFGLTDTLDEIFRSGMQRYLSSIYAGQTEEMYHGLTELLIGTERTDYEAFHDDFLAETRAWLRDRDRGVPGEPSDRSAIARYMVGVLGAARRHRLRIPPAMLSMYRSLLTAETVASRLGGGADLRTEGRKFFTRLQQDEALQPPPPEALRVWTQELVTLVADSPRQVHRLLSDLTQDRFTLSVRTSLSRDERRLQNGRTRLVTMAILQVALTILLVGVDRIPQIPALPAHVVLGALVIASYVCLGVMWRRLG
jgi:ubiquinone biosynthesis protein